MTRPPAPLRAFPPAARGDRTCGLAKPVPRCALNHSPSFDVPIGNMNSLPLTPKLSRKFRLQFEPAQDRWVLLYPEGMVQLNPSAAEILKRCTGTASVDEIVDSLQTVFNVQGIAPEVRNLLEEGQRRGWID